MTQAPKTSHTLARPCTLPQVSSSAAQPDPLVACRWPGRAAEQAGKTARWQRCRFWGRHDNGPETFSTGPDAHTAWLRLGRGTTGWGGGRDTSARAPWRRHQQGSRAVSGSFNKSTLFPPVLVRGGWGGEEWGCLRPITPDPGAPLWPPKSGHTQDAADTLTRRVDPCSSHARFLGIVDAFTHRPSGTPRWGGGIWEIPGPPLVPHHHPPQGSVSGADMEPQTRTQIRRQPAAQGPGSPRGEGSRKHRALPAHSQRDL